MILSNLNESQILEAYNLKVTIGALKFDGRNETQTLKAKRIKACKSNYPIPIYRDRKLVPRAKLSGTNE
jgi:hypothetical protein